MGLVRGEICHPHQLNAWRAKGLGKKHRTKLAGAKFLTFLIGEARKLNKEMIYLEVRPSNIVGRRLYDRFGFTQLGLRRAYYPAVTGREDALFLGLNISIKRI